MASHENKRYIDRVAGITRTINAALAHHRAGRLDRAAALYHKALERDPGHADALHLLGVVAFQRGEIESSIKLIERALPELDNLPDAHLNLGNALQAGGRIVEAVESFRRTIALDPEYGMAYNNLAYALNDQGMFEAGLESARRAVELIPDFPGAHLNHATAATALGRFDEAEIPCRRALELQQNNAKLHGDLGRILTELGRVDEAVASYRRAVALSSDFADAHYGLGNALKVQGRLDDAVTSYRRAIELKPDFAEAHYNLGNALQRLDRLDEAVQSYQQAVRLKLDFAEAHYNLGALLKDLGKLEEAAASYRRAVALAPDFASAHNNLGNVLQALNRLDEAVESYQRAIRLKPDFAEAHNNLGGALKHVGKIEEAVASCRSALALAPDFAEAHNNLGNAFLAQGRFDAAVESFHRAVSLRPNLAEAHFNLGNAWQAQNQCDEAVTSFRRAVQLRPELAEAHHNLGAALVQQNRLDEAIESYRRAIALRPDFANSHSNLGNLLRILGKAEEAIASCQRALALRPDDVSILNNLGAALGTQNRFGEAVASFRRALALDPDDGRALRSLGDLLNLLGKRSEAMIYYGRAVALEPEDSGLFAAWFNIRQYLCDWAHYREDEARVRKGLGPRPAIGSTFTLLGLSSTPAEQLDCARGIAAKIAVAEAAMLSRRRGRPGGRIRLGYLSADFRRHPVAFLIAGLIEHHDRRNFEVIGYSYGPEDRSTIRTRLIDAFDRFVDIEKTSYRQAAELIHSDGVDILVDLTGYTAFNRSVILAHRAAPIQVNYLGYPGTMGAEFIDYIIVDPFVVPPDQQTFFSEKLVHLPDCYQCNDDKREIAERTPSRGECGLPEGSFVFCCFNNSYKITPTFFDIWMRLLRAVPESVLWLLDSGVSAIVNLAREAAARGVAPERLVFAPRAALPEHLARHRVADLFLDTLPYNAHTTASDALWAGLPLLTCTGDTFAGRVAGSLLRAIGLDELMTTSLDEYEALALRLAREPEMLARLRARLEKNRLTHPLFDTDRFAGNIETAYRQMWETWKTGKPPAAFAVSPTARHANGSNGPHRGDESLLEVESSSPSRLRHGTAVSRAR